MEEVIRDVQEDGCGRTSRGSVRFKTGLKYGCRGGRDEERGRQAVQ